MIAEYDGNNKLLRKYIYGPGIDQPVCMIEVADSNAVYYYHYDALGSVVALSDGNGDTVQTYEYSVFGQVAAEDPNHPNPYMFTGRRFDIEIGLYYNRARYYNPFTGRFLQTDPASQGMNLYSYCGNNALNLLDPSGQWAAIDFKWVANAPQHLWLSCWDDAERKHLGTDFYFKDWNDLFDYIDENGADFCDLKSRVPTISFSGDMPSTLVGGSLALTLGAVAAYIGTDGFTVGMINGLPNTVALAAQMWALRQFLDPSSASSYGRWAYNDNSDCHEFAVGVWKCNKFIHDAYTLGADVPYPVYSCPVGQKPWPITAYGMAKGITTNLSNPSVMYNYPVVTDGTPLMIGDIISIPTGSREGHMGIYMGSGQMIQAGRRGVVITDITDEQWQNMIVRRYIP